MNEAEELARLVSEIRETVKIMLAVQTPELPRPKVAPDTPATQELAEWSMRVYAYSLLCQFREVLDSTVLLYDSGHVPAVFLCCRSLFEMAAHSYYTKKWVVDHLRKKNYDAAWKFMLGINQGSRYMKGKYEKLPPIELVDGPHIGRVINTFNEYFKEHGDNEAREKYSFLSEFCHPNSFAFTNHIDFTEKKDDVVVTFAKPSPNICIQALPDAWYSSGPLLFSLNELLEACGNKTSNGAVQAYAKIVERGAEGKNY
jgi:hypothetical protein